MRVAGPMLRCFWVAIFVLLAVLTGCGGNGGSTQLNTNNAPALSSIQISGPSANLLVGQNQQMTATGKYSGGSSQNITNAVSWSSSDSTIASIATGGMLTANKAGQCTITASMSGVSGSFSVKVAPALVSIAITPANPTIAPATTVQFIATGTYTDNSTQNLTSQVAWSSSNTAAATISSTAPTTGLALAVAPGNTTITATLGAISGTTTLTVSNATATALALTPTNAAIALGLNQQYKATATFSDGSSQDVTGVSQWSSSSSSVASITVSGLATARNIGTTTITATFSGASASTSLMVNAANLNSITIQPGNGSIAPGTSTQIVAMGNFNDGSTRDVTHQATWTSSNTAVATVGSSSGIAFGKSPGSVTLTATLGSVVGSAPFTVTNATIVSVVVAPTGKTIPTGGSGRFTATGVFSDSTQQDITAGVSWTSSDTTVATVVNTSNNPGLAIGVSAGTANINATFSYAGTSVTGTTLLTVSSATLSSLALTPASTEIAPASGVQFSAIGTFTDGTTQFMNPLLAWTSSNTKVATLNPTGFATGQSAGVVQITATANSGVNASANLLVEGGTVTTLQVTPQSGSVPVNYVGTFNAVATFSDGNTQNLTSFATWTSSNASVATVSNAQATAGVVTGVQPGTSTISALFAGQVGTATVTVTNATLVAISISPANPSIPVGTAQQFRALGSFSDGSTLDLTTQVNWSSSSPTIATISSPGLANALSSGTSTISASLNGVSAQTVLTVQ